MFDRKSIKTEAKAVLKKSYWTSILVLLLLMLLGVTGFTTVNHDRVKAEITSSQMYEAVFSGDSDAAVAVGVMVGIVLLILVVIMVVCFVYFECPLIAGSARYFLKAEEGEVEPGHLLSFFKPGIYKNATKTIFREYLSVVLWSLLLVIPGIIKAYQYRMVEYILSEHPEMTPTEVLQASRDMMAGNKWDTFVFDLSFIGWDILGAITCGLVQFFYVRPYKMHADAGLYLALKNQDKAKA